MVKRAIGKCLACGWKVEWENWASGPVCYPCYYGAKLLYENGIDKIENIPAALQPTLESIFKKNGYNWPTDLSWSFINRHFDKCDTQLLRWWSPTKKQQENDLLDAYKRG